MQGRLKNGLRYAILPRRGNEPGVGLLMRVEGGFIAERRPGERGLAHLVEHIVFRSPTNAAPDELHRFPRVGLPLTFPAPTAASTSWRESNYFVATRGTTPADLDTLLGLFREVAGDLTFRPDAVDAERASVMREMADKKLGNDIYARYVAAIAPGSPTDVIDAQNSDDVPTASVETIRALYHRLYRPTNTMIVIVGDVDAAQMETLIRKRFDSWQGVGPVPGRLRSPRFRSDGIAPISHSNFRYGRNGAMMTVATPLPVSPPSRSGQAETMLMDMLAIRAVNNRLALARPDYPPGKYGMFIENGEQGHRLLILWDDFIPGRWRQAVAGLKKTTCDLSTTGWSETEWTTAKRDVTQDLERRAADMAGAPNVELAKDLSHAVADGRDLIPPDELLRHARTRLPTLDARAANDWWRRQWRAGVEHLRVEAAQLAQVENPETAIRAAADEAVQVIGCKMRVSRPAMLTPFGADRRPTL
ncbi:M16 family metallopeptidase, partial [uncultured Sphingomonas sp.]|uniref:M16 family metallopeptidase n=1 Tax=uncultured Sphingomonas sp. TaxID=158754 RepID=UPI0035CB0360